MTSTSRVSALAAGATGAALFTGATFVSAPSSTPKLRANSAVANSASKPLAQAPSSVTASLALAGTAVAALSAGSRKAFASVVKPQLVTLTAFENELGVQAPVGFWDPVGFTADGDVAAFKRRRSVELKHGRISMMATMGYITPEVIGKLPGFLSPSAGLKFADIPNGLAAIAKVPVAGWAQIAAYFGFVEFSGGFDDYKTGTPGDYGFKVLTSSDPEEKTKKLSAELANGRLAMMAIIGMFFQDGLTGSAWGDWANYTASPLRAGRESKVARNFFGGETSYSSFDPAKELGVQEPIGFWDPLGLSADKDEATFKRRRAVEIKHGRIAMYATMGYIVPEYYKFPGYLSPSLGLKFSDVPNGLAALSKLPVLGGAQIIAFAGLIETTGFFQAASTTDGRGPREGQFSMKDSTETGEPGNYGVGFPTFLGKVEDPEVRKSKLAAELANGRLAMMAIIGMFFQDGLTGSAWGDWSLYTASPLRAEEAEEPPKPPPFDPAKQVGAMEPLGYFDPAGFCKVGDKEGFQNLRAAEIKHGRVAMMAALGAVAQHYIKFPGFESVPAGVGAVTTAPGTYGFAALFLLSGAMELAVWTQDPNKEAGDFGDPLGLGQYNEEFRNKELNNGRFAMFAAIGIISADLLTGKDAIQQFG